MAQDEARALIEDGHWKRARAVLEPKVKANPADAEAAALLSRVRLTFGDLDGAAELAAIAVKLKPDVADYHWRLSIACGEQAKRASMFGRISRAKCFREEADAAIARDPQHIEARLYLISYFAGAPAIAGGDRKKANQLAEEVARINPAAGYLARARIVEEDKPATDKQGAAEREALYKQSLDAAKTPRDRYTALVALLNVYTSGAAQNFERVEQHAKELLALAPQRSAAYTGLAVSYAARARWTELDAALAQSEQAIPDNLAPFYQAGRIILTQGGDYARAERYFRKFLTQEPEAGPVSLAHAHWRLGLVLEKQGRKADAIAEIERATRLMPDLNEAKDDLRRLRK